MVGAVRTLTSAAIMSQLHHGNEACPCNSSLRLGISFRRPSRCMLLARLDLLTSEAFVKAISLNAIIIYAGTSWICARKIKRMYRRHCLRRSRHSFLLEEDVAWTMARSAGRDAKGCMAQQFDIQRASRQLSSTPAYFHSPAGVGHPGH